ncbi:hypothetical protein FRB95_004200, partial [Tulasnella sp. JGI-2019a]
MEASRKMIFVKLNNMTMRLADWAIAKLSTFATPPVPGPLPPTPTRTYYTPTQKPLTTTPTPSSAIATGSALQPYTILVLIILTASFILLTALRFSEHVSTDTPSLTPSHTPLDPSCLDDLTSDDIAEAKDMPNDDLYRLVCFLFGKCEEQEHKITSLSTKINHMTRLAERPSLPSAPPAQTSDTTQSTLSPGRSYTHTLPINPQPDVTA